jgi:hypothetical protein
VQHHSGFFTDLAVGLGPIRACPFRGDPELGAAVTPQVRLVAATVVAEHPVDVDAAVSDPGDRVAQDLGRGLLGLVVAGLDLGDSGVVVDDGVQVGDPDHWVPILAARSARPRDRCRSALLTLLAADVAPATAVGDLAEASTSTWIRSPGCSCS